MTSRKKILIIDEVHSSIFLPLENHGFFVDYQPLITQEKVFEIIAGYQGLVVRSKVSVNRELIASATQLQFVARAGAGIDNIDVEVLKKNNIALITAPEGNMDAVGEHTLGLLLTLLHKISSADTAIKSGYWDREKNRGMELKGKTVGIIGYGNMGSSFAQKLSGLGCTVLAYDKYKEDFSTEEILKVSLNELKQRTDILSLHIPLTPETNHWIDEKELLAYEQLKVVINTARGGVLVLGDLIKLLDSKKLLGAALDVFSDEPIHTNNKVFSVLKNMNNVVMTPHVAGWSFESYQKISEIIAKKIIQRV